MLGVLTGSLLAFLLVLAGARLSAPLAQTAAEHKADHHHGSKGYHRRFDQAEVWAKEFDDPARDVDRPNGANGMSRPGPRCAKLTRR